MDVLITGGAGTVGTAITDHLAGRPDYSFVSLDVEAHPDPDIESVVADVADPEVLRTHVDGRDAVVHLAHAPTERGGPGDRSVAWSADHAANLRLHATVVAEAVRAGLDSLVFASSNHAVGLYEVEHAPAIYRGEVDLTVDHTAPPRPDSMYGAEKVYGEGLCRFAASAHGLRCYALRICAVRDRAHDHPYADAEAGVAAGRFERDSEAYAEQVARLQCMWQSRRDLGHLVARCLRDESVAFEVLYGVSDNRRRCVRHRARARDRRLRAHRRRGGLGRATGLTGAQTSSLARSRSSCFRTFSPWGPSVRGKDSTKATAAGTL